jgi:hypothetical protein
MKLLMRWAENKPVARSGGSQRLLGVKAEFIGPLKPAGVGGHPVDHVHILTQ